MPSSFIHLGAALAILGLAHHADAGGRRLPPSFPPLLHSAVPLPPPPQPTAIPSRNMVNLVERGLATSWSVEENKLKNIKWSADLGSVSFGTSFGTPIVAHGKAFIINNQNPCLANGNRRIAVFMAFRESDGKFLWQIDHDYPEAFADARGMMCSPAVDGQSLYYVTPACEVICANSVMGNVTWRYDMMKQLKVVPGTSSCFLDWVPLGSPLIIGDLFVFVTTGKRRQK